MHAVLYLDLPDALRTAWIDGSLVVATAAAYVLCRGWSAWPSRAARQSAPTP